MKKIFIVGIVASGKTTLAKRLSNLLEIPWYELDDIVHFRTADGRIKRKPEEQVDVIRKIDGDGQWIFEGTDRESYQCLYDMADTIIFIDPPLWRRRTRIITRFLKQRVGIEKSHYTPDLSMLRMMYKWTSDFEKNRDNFEGKLCKYRGKLIRLSDNTDLSFINK